MKKHAFGPVTLGLLALGASSALLTGCGKPASDAPAAGYPGGQKSGAVNNATSDPNYAQKAMRGGTSGSSGRPTSGGMPTSGGH